MILKYFLELTFKVELSLLVLCLVVMVSSNSATNKPSEDMFKQLFKVRRAEQLEAVKKLRKLPEDKQLKMVQTATKTIFDVILKSKVILENAGFVPGISDFPEAESVRDALSLVLENTALIGEIALRLPELSESLLHTTPEWMTTLSWSLDFVNKTGLVDTITNKLLSLVSQELNFTSRSTDFINPYRKVKDKPKEPTAQDKIQSKKKKKTSEIPRGPRLTLRQAGDL